MSDLHAAAHDYLALRRAVGFKLDRHDQFLEKFIGFVEASGASTITTDLALAWATSPLGADSWWWQQRLAVVRGFARYLQGIDPETEVPPTGLITAVVPRATPYMFTDADITRLLDTTDRLEPTFRAATYRTVLGLLAVTGMRVSEAINLDDVDVDLGEGFLVVRHSKFARTRELVLHPSTIDALRSYRATRQQRRVKPQETAFFISTVGTRLFYPNVLGVFHRLIDQSGMHERRQGNRPRIHDLRHSFAVRTMIDAYATAGVDIGPRFAALSTYLGHRKPADTYWYLSATPELLGQAALRLEETFGEWS